MALISRAPFLQRSLISTMFLPIFGLATVVLAGLADAFPTNTAGYTDKLSIKNKIGSIRAKDLLTKERARISSFAAAISSGPLINEDVSYVCQPCVLYLLFPRDSRSS